MLDKVKGTLGITISDYDNDLKDLIEAAKADLGLAGNLQAENTADPLIIQAIKTYVKMNFGAPENYDQLVASYEKQKGLMRHATGYTEWDEGDDC